MSENKYKPILMNIPETKFKSSWDAINNQAETIPKNLKRTHLSRNTLYSDLQNGVCI